MGNGNTVYAQNNCVQSGESSDRVNLDKLAFIVFTKFLLILLGSIILLL